MARSSGHTCNDYALAAVRQSGSGRFLLFQHASAPSQRVTRGLPVMAVYCRALYLYLCLHPVGTVQPFKQQLWGC